MGQGNSVEAKARAAGAINCLDYLSGQRGMIYCDGKCGSTATVWGTGPYTADSCVCRAARHAGIIDAKGGLFEVDVGPPQEDFRGSAANGVTTHSYKKSDTTMRVIKTAKK